MEEMQYFHNGRDSALRNEPFRRTGIEITGDVPWGTHFCMFYSSKEDLLDILIPYFRAGLEGGEFCMWITSKPLTKNAAQTAMRKAMPGFDKYLETGQIEILAHDEWYVQDGVFDSDRVLRGWVERHDRMREKGFRGLRLSGNTFWLEKETWQDFMLYEEAINGVIGNYRMLALCTYSMDRCGAAEILDVARTHEFVLANKGNRWTMVENAQIKQTKEALYRNNEKLEILSDTAALLLKSSDPQTVVESLCRRVMDFLDCQVFFNYLADDGKACLRLNAWSGIPEETAKSIEWLQYGEAVCGCAARDARGIVAEDIPETPDPRTDLVRSFGIRA
ncbi:MAG: MEDS domain-containing protein, partial [Syntrophaceae bacterium]